MTSFSAMVNSWSLLHDELKMDEINDDGMRPWGHSDYEFLINNNMSNDIIKQSPSTPWKYNEEEIVKELLEYIRGTYNQHYSCLLYTSPSPRDKRQSRMPSSA